MKENSYGRPPEPAIHVRWRNRHNDIQLTVNREIAATVLKLCTAIVLLVALCVWTTYLR